MNLNMLLTRNAGWLKGTGENADIVFSSRVRLARNVEGMSFPHKASNEEKDRVRQIVLKAIGNCRFLKNALIVNVEDLDAVDRYFLMERHLVSTKFTELSSSSAVIVSEKEILSLMVNEEDHIRLQAIQSGLQLTDSWRLADQLDTALSTSIDFAYSDNWGFLTTCPTNTGTGMRASLMLHLPCLVLSGQISKVLRAITKLGFAARGLHGEGTEPSGDLFQISNQVTMGTSEEDMIGNIERVGKQVAAHERNARSLLLRESPRQVEDKIFRALGILRNVRIISSDEALKLLSRVRLGIDLGLITTLSSITVNQLFVFIQPGHLQKAEGRELSPPERDEKRADVIQEKLKKDT